MPNIKIAYGILKGAGIDTSKIQPKDVWDEVNKLNNKNNETQAEKQKLEDLGIYKTFEIPDKIKEYYKKNFNEYKIKKINIKKIIEDNDLLNDKSLLNRRKMLWGNSINDYKIDKQKLSNEKYNPIRISIKNNKYFIEDGMHRIVALYNSGYDEAEMLIKI